MTDQTEEHCPRCATELSPTATHCPECFLRVRDDGTPDDPRLALMGAAWEREHPDEARAWDPHGVEAAAAAASPPPRPGPQAASDAPPPRPSVPFAPLEGRAKAATWALAVVAGLALVVIASTAFEIELLERVSRGEAIAADEANANDSRQQLLGFAQLAGYLLAAVLFIRWFHAAYRNSAALAGPQRFGPGWAIGGWFVPILWWWRPKEIANDIDDACGGQAVSLLRWWWAVWLIGNWLSNLVYRRLSRSDTLDELIGADYVAIVSGVFDIVGALLAIRVVQVLTARMTAAHAARTSGPS